VSRLTSQYPERVYSTSEEKPAHPLLERARSNGSGLLLAGLAALGVGALAWYYFGPDVRRYLKIRNM
jgi:hypothetical protein